MGLPYHRYLLWQFVEGKDVNQVTRALDEASLPIPGVAVLSDYLKQSEELPLSAGTRRRLAKKALNAEFDYPIFKKLGLGDICQGTEKLNALLQNPVLRISLECLILAKVPLSEGMPLLQEQHGEVPDEDAVELYKQCFFDIVRMGKFEWRDYLKSCSTDSYLYTRYLTALTKPQSDLMHLLGLPSKPEYSRFLKNLLSTAEYKFKRYSGWDTAEGDSEARKWAKVGIEAGVRFDKFSSGDSKSLTEALQMEFDHAEAIIPDVTGEMLAATKPPTGEEAAQKVLPPPALFPDMEV